MYMNLCCPYCDFGVDYDDFHEKAEVRQAEYDFSIYHFTCTNCHKEFRIIMRLTETYESEEL